MSKYKIILIIGALLLFSLIANQTVWEVASKPLAIVTTVPLSEEAFVPAGEAIIGCSEDTVGEMGCATDARPMHVVYLDAYYIDKTEVSNAQYADCVANFSQHIERGN